ncbi:baseplate J/gp47 family protein [Paenibacillus sp. GCM10012303]|uniref:baseplate J/gp47 family protein n=1 Tax=Paenibacillus sp. GCM10012303 TaxID=3317340 RepID=UPI00361F90FA
MATLPNYLQDQSEEQILRRMLDALPSDLDKSEGSFIWDAVSPAAIELAQAAIWAQEVLRRGFAGTTFGTYLDLRCEEHGVTRKPAVRSTGQVVFSGKAGATVPAGTVVVTLADPVTGTPSISFATKSPVTLNGQGAGSAAIEAVRAGKEGNVPALAISLLASSVPGVTSVRNEIPTTGGQNTEDDESLLQRYLAKVRQPATSGNVHQYRQWAMEVPGIGDAKVFPLWDGPGTVKVTVVDADRQPVGPQTLAEVAAYLEQVRPIGANPTIVSATAKPISIAATVTLAAGFTIQSVVDAFSAAMVDYFKETAFTSSYVSYARIATLLLNTPGVTDHTGLALDGGTANVPLDAEQIPVLGTVNLGV